MIDEQQQQALKKGLINVKVDVLKTAAQPTPAGESAKPKSKAAKETAAVKGKKGVAGSAVDLEQLVSKVPCCAVSQLIGDTFIVSCTVSCIDAFTLWFNLN